MPGSATGPLPCTGNSCSLAAADLVRASIACTCTGLIVLLSVSRVIRFLMPCLLRLLFLRGIFGSRTSTTRCITLALLQPCSRRPGNHKPCVLMWTALFVARHELHACRPDDARAPRLPASSAYFILVAGRTNCASSADKVTMRSPCRVCLRITLREPRRVPWRGL